MCAVPGSLLIILEQQLHQLLLVGGPRGFHLHRLHLRRRSRWLLSNRRLILVPLHVACGVNSVSSGLLRARSARVKMFSGDRNARRLSHNHWLLQLLAVNGNVLVHEGGNEWLQIDCIELTDIVEVVLDVGQQGLLLGVNILEVEVHLVGGGHLVWGLFEKGLRGCSGFLVLVHESVDGHGLILGTRWTRLLLVLDGLADDADGSRALLLVLLEPLAQLAYLRG